MICYPTLSFELHTTNGLPLHLIPSLKKAFDLDISFLFDSNYYRKYEKKNVKEILESSDNGHKDKDRVIQGVKWWKNIVLVKSFKEIE
ncbi:hypothetical protein Tco_0229171, partial [Tanacetum coccineum]